MAKRFVPVYDQEKAKCEQQEEELRKHRQFDAPHALLATNLDEGAQPKHDMNPLGKPTGELYLDEHQLWREKEKVFGKKKTWGRETFEYSNPEEARQESGPRARRAGDVGWGVNGTFGGRASDIGVQALQRGEVSQAMVKNDKGLWVRKKDAAEAKAPVARGCWRCPKCEDDNIKKRTVCKNCQYERKPMTSDMMEPAKMREDPRLEAAKLKGRGTQDAAKEALRALEERRSRERTQKEELGLMARKSEFWQRNPPGNQRNNGQQQVKASKRLRKFDRWQGVQRSEDDARRIVGMAEGTSHIGKVEKSALAGDDAEGGGDSGSGSSSSSEESSSGDSEASRIPERRSPRERSKSRSRSRSAQTRPSRSESKQDLEKNDVVVDFF